MTLEEKFQDLIKNQRDAMASYASEDADRLIDLQRMAFYYGAITMQRAYDGTVQTSTAVKFKAEVDAFKEEFA